jgi:hypothetical protein
MTDIFVNPKLVAKCHAAMPLNGDQVVRVFSDDIKIQLGRCDPIPEATERAIDALIVLYDLGADAEGQKRLRKTFRKLMTRYRGLSIGLLAPIRTRLLEHKLCVMCGLDPPDPDERRKGRAP